MSFLTKVFGTRNDKIIKQMMPLVAKINGLEPTYESMSDEELVSQTAKFRERYDGGESLDSILPEAFAVCREGSKRVLGMRHFDVQLIGGVVLHQGRIAEMKTGEGKTLTATLPCYLHGLTGKGAHVVTVNDYLAKRDSEWMGKLYNFLGLSTGNIVHGMSDTERQEAYAADITYGTNNEFGFDYLRDNMKTDAARITQRPHNFAIVDEVDSILIDEARTPLIISGATETDTEIYGTVNRAIPGLQNESDYLLDEKSRTVSLTEDGISKLEKRLRIDNLYDPKNIKWLHHVQQALKAHVLFKKDVDYVVRDGQIYIVDEHTGRLMPGRRYSDGLHGALEAKEHVEVQQESQTLATITFQNYFRLYKILSGMTGTADTEAAEFHKIYSLDVVVIPTNMPIAREDAEDVIYLTALEKFKAIAEEIQRAQSKGQPVLVGTVSVEKSELLSNFLTKLNVPHEILNAKNHSREATIVADAGKAGHVTIATNMAGRGTDIVLGEGVKEKGGLYVIGTERHESRRIDNQLRGRSGRQGDPGKSRFYLSLEDDLMRIFASDRLQGIMSRLGMQEGEPIVSPMVTRTIEKAQKRVEGQHFASRKHLLEYDDVMSQQRQVIYGRRRNALFNKAEVDFMGEVVEDIAFHIAKKFSPEEIDDNKYDFAKIKETVLTELGENVDLSSLEADQCTDDMIAKLVSVKAIASYAEKMKSVDEEMKARVEAYVYLQIIDQGWKEHLQAMDSLKDSVSLKGYGQRDPLQEYKKEAFVLFRDLMDRLEEETTMTLVRMQAPTVTAESDYHVEGEDLEQLNYAHADAPSAVDEMPPQPQQGGGAQRTASDGMIYYGSRDEGEDEAQKRPQTYRREGAKVGRNDPCPCGSGKKYKKCHGAPGAQPMA